MNTTHISGFPRVGAKRELKFAIEKLWRSEATEEDVIQVAKDIRKKNRDLQIASGLNLVPVNDFSLYDHVLDQLVLVGGIPVRFGFNPQELGMKQYFQLARGNKAQPAMEMTKWFDTNYHYLVPEWTKGMSFKANTTKLINELKEAKSADHDLKPTIVGPVSLLYLGKVKGDDFNRLDLLEKLVPVYQEILRSIVNEGVTWVQIDEPILGLDLEKEWLDAFSKAYKDLGETGAKILLGTYFSSVEDHIDLLKSLPIHGVHIDAVRAPEQLKAFEKSWPESKVLSVGVVDGRNIWKCDLRKALGELKGAAEKFGNNLWVSTSCSLLHSPQDLSIEEKLSDEIKSWMSFAVQKLGELNVLKGALEHGEDSVKAELEASDKVQESRKTSPLIHRANVKDALKNLPANADKRASDFETRIKKQQDLLNLPLLPTTTIGSFPQTKEIREARSKFKKGEIGVEEYENLMKKEIKLCVDVQEELDIDVLVHGEAERNDMVEYFGELMEGYCFTQFGWVQSYGSRCVKPPIIYGDIDRPEPMTVRWITYAQSLTKRPMKGMLTGPVTMLQWSFVRNDIPRKEVCDQIALALNKEVLDLEKAGINVIQIDEPAYREGLPLRKKDWDEYLTWASRSFRLSSTNVKDTTQIHTHMCYSEFNDILPAIAAMDADVITIETSRSDMELLDAFVKFKYPNDIGPGVYDIHSPRVPEESEYVHLLEKALEVIPARRLWVNPDCGLKTRAWPETKAALERMVKVAKELRAKLA